MAAGAAVPRCPVCGANHVTCGASRPVAPVDLIQLAKGPVMTEEELELTEYEVVHNGVSTTMQLNKIDAERLGAKKKTTTVGSTEARTINHPGKVADKSRRTGT